MINKRQLRLAATAAALAAATLLGACFDGDDDDEVVTPPPPTGSSGGVPNSALVDASSFTAYVRSLVNANSDTAAPVEINNISNAPTVDTAEPAAI